MHRSCHRRHTCWLLTGLPLLDEVWAAAPHQVSISIVEVLSCNAVQVFSRHRISKQAC